MEFPFCLNVDKTFPDLNLADGRVSEFFLKSINSLNVPVSMDSALVSSSEVAGEKLIPELHEAVGVSEVKEGVIPEVERVNTGGERVNAVPEADGVNTGIENGDTGTTGVEGVKEAAGTCDTDDTCENSGDSNSGEKRRSEEDLAMS